MNDNSYSQIRTILKLNQFIHHEKLTFKYHMQHVKLARRYALLLNKKLGNKIDPTKVTYFALCHDLFKESGLCPFRDGKVFWNQHPIPQNLNRYVRMNLDILDKFNLTDYFNTDVQLHALAAGIFINKELGIEDPEILYPVFFHSCPIMDVYKTLDPNVQTAVDIMVLADKLSSNYLKNNMCRLPVRIDLDKAVFGPDGVEFNYSLGLYLAKLIGQGKSPDKQSLAATEYYYNRLTDMNPVISKNNGIKKLGGNKLWPKRISQVWKMQ